MYTKTEAPKSIPQPSEIICAPSRSTTNKGSTCPESASECQRSYNLQVSFDPFIPVIWIFPTPLFYLEEERTSVAASTSLVTGSQLAWFPHLLIIINLSGSCFPQTTLGFSQVLKLDHRSLPASPIHPYPIPES